MMTPAETIIIESVQALAVEVAALRAEVASMAPPLTEFDVLSQQHLGFVAEAKARYEARTKGAQHA